MDDMAYQTARRLAPFAANLEEQSLAREALRLADRELDEAFASALREATAQSDQLFRGPLKSLSMRIAEQRTKVDVTAKKIDALTKVAPSDDKAASELERSKAEQNLNQDELEDLQQEVIRQGGNLHLRVETAIHEHEASENSAIPWLAATAEEPSTLWAQFTAWQTLRDRRLLVGEASSQAQGKAASLLKERNQLQQLVAKQKPSEQDDQDTAMLARLRQLSDQKRTILELDKRSAHCKQLAGIYERWTAVIDHRSNSSLRLLLRSLALVFTVILMVLLATNALTAFIVKQHDRRFHQLRVAGSAGLQVIGVLAVLLILFGPPKDVSMVLGLLTAGLTVALKDFILAFFGWFILMGKNGISLGDWVEIEGVGGEVIELGILHTVLLEMGHWSNGSRPTGRRVSFGNKYAIEHHFFNFSTEGQWLWDELQVTVPVTGDPYQTAQLIRQLVEKATAEDARLAEADWQRVTHKYGNREFSAKPAVDLRPSVNHINVIVRYITRAPQRYEVKSRLFEALVELLQKNSDVTKK